VPIFVTDGVVRLVMETEGTTISARPSSTTSCGRND
jgi:hypothetical protein